MSGESKQRRIRALWIALVLWAAATVMSFVDFGLSKAGLIHTDTQSTGYFDDATGFLGWQSLAFVLAIAAYVVGRRLPVGTLTRRLSRFPAIVVGVMALGLASVYFAAWAGER